MSKTLMLVERPSGHGWMPRALSAVRSYWKYGLSLKDPKSWFGEGAKSDAGIMVNEASAFTFSAVFDAVNQGSSDVAKLPLNLYKRRKDGGSDVYVDSKIYRLLKYEPNPEMGSMVFRRTVTAHALTLGNGYAEIERDGAGRPAALWPLTPDRVQPFRDRVTTGGYGPLRYRIDGRTVLDAVDMIHIQGLGYDGSIGYDVINKARQAIGLALAAEKFGSAFFANGSTFGGLLAFKQNLGPDGEARVRKAIDDFHQSVEKAHKIGVFGGDPTLLQFGVPPDKAQMNELRTKQVEEVARFFNMPVHKLKNLDRATNNNIEQQDLEYYKGFLLNWLTVWEEELNRKLISPLENRQQFIKHNVNAFLRADITTRFESYAKMLDRGVYNADMVLDLEEMNPQPDGQGKLFLVQGAMQPKDKIVELADAQIQKAKAPPPAPTPADPAPQARAIDILLEQVRAAEAVAEEARVAAQAERELRIAAETSGTATAAELTTLRDADQRSSALATQLTAMSEQLRADAAAERRRAEEALAAQTIADAARLASDEASAAAVSAAEQANARTVAAEQLAEAARLDAQAAESRAVEALTASTAAVTERDAALVSLATAEATAEAARADVERVETESRGRFDETVAVRTAAELASREAERLLAEQQRLVTETEQRLSAAETAAEAARAEHTQARARQAELEAERATFEQGAIAANAAAETARVEADRLMEAARGSIATAEARAEAEALRAEAALQEQAQLRTEAETLQQQIAAGAQERTAALALADQERHRADDLDQTVLVTRTQMESLTTLLADTRGSHDTAVSGLQIAIEALERERDAARAQADEQAATAAASATQIQALESDVRQIRQADAEAMTSIITAHRSLIVDVMRRMVERETDRARRAQATPEKFKRWLETFYDGHADLMRTALLPAVRIHLAFIRSIEDPAEAVRRVVDEHVRQSERQLRAVLDDDADDVATSVSALMFRWDQERPTVLADALMAKELDYARSL